LQLIIDIGNTRIKFALFKEQTFFVKGVGDINELKAFCKGKKIKKAIVSSVSKSDLIESFLIEYNIPFIHLTHQTKLPIFNNYDTPKTLGDDRLANVVGAKSIYPKRNVLTIDCGTCVKFDVITGKKEYFGGAISPGLAMRFKALNTFTNGLPLIDYNKIDYLIGKSTNESILSGVINGCLAEIDGIIAKYSAIYENLTIILTGGDAKYFENELKSNIFAEPNLTLIGLNEILLFNN
jgi:type III pantothenate kinase